MSIPLRLGPANYWIRDKVLFSAWSRCALKTGHGGTEKKEEIKERHLNFGFSESHWVGNQSSEKPLSGQGEFHIRPDLSHLPGFFSIFPPLRPQGSGTTGRYQTHSEEEEGMDRENETDGEAKRQNRVAWVAHCEH